MVRSNKGMGRGRSTVARARHSAEVFCGCSLYRYRRVVDRLIKAPAIGLEIEPHGGRGDDLDVEIGELEVCSGADPFEPSTRDVEGVFGGVEQNTPGTRHGKAAQARSAGGYRDGEVQGQEGLATFWLAADMASLPCWR
jgi:hypothetical protein